MRRILSATSICALVLAFVPQVGNATQAIITVEQTSPQEVGAWSITFQDGEAVKTNDLGSQIPSHTLTVDQHGPAVLSIAPPAGASARLLVHRNGTLIATENTQQYTFSTAPDDTYRFIIQYSFTKLGTLGVTSEPNGVNFRLEGPGGKKYSGITPKTFTNLPAGRYTITPSLVTGCYQGRPVSATVQTGKRSVASFSVTCANPEQENVDRSRPSRRSIRDNVYVRDSKYYNRP